MRLILNFIVNVMSNSFILFSFTLENGYITFTLICNIHTEFGLCATKVSRYMQSTTFELFDQTQNVIGTAFANHFSCRGAFSL